MRPVFFSIELTFDSSFLSSTFDLAGAGVGLVAAAFLTGAGAAAAAAGLGGSGFGSSAGGCASGVGFTFTSAGTGFDVLAALGAGGVKLFCVALRWTET